MISAVARRSRVGSSHYIGGFGDGKVSITNTAQQPVAYLRRPTNPQDADAVTADVPANNNLQLLEEANIRHKQRNKRASTTIENDDINFPPRDYRRKRFETSSGGAADVHFAGPTNRLTSAKTADEAAYGGGGWSGIYEGQSAYDNRGATGQFQSSAVVLMAAVVFMSALFLHLISDTNEKNNNLRRRRRHHIRQRPLIVKNKKTDEWIDDAEEDSIHHAGSTTQNADKNALPGGVVAAPPRPPAVYYHPYQPRQRQRLVPTSAASGKNVAAATTAATASASGPNITSRGQQAQAAATTTAAQPQQQQVNGEVYPTASNYYMLSSSSSSFRMHDGTGSSHGHQQRNSLEPPLSPPRVDLGTTTTRTRLGSSSYQATGSGTTPPMQLHQRISPRPPQQQVSPVPPGGGGAYNNNNANYTLQPPPPRAVALLTDVSSFGSLTGEGGATKNVTPPLPPPPPIMEHGTTATKQPSPRDEEIGYSRKNSPPYEQRISTAPSSKSPILLSPGTEDVEETTVLRRGRRKSSGELHDTTPRIANRKLLAPAARAAVVPPQFPATDEVSEPSAASSAMAFASPPKQPKQRQDEEPPLEISPVGFPYVPNLAVPNLDHHQEQQQTEHHGNNAYSQPPRSINIHELQLYRMESGNNVSHWHARVAEETRTIQDRVFAASYNNESASYVDKDANLSIPSDDPRGGIDHKRDDLTMDTDSAASLQGAIDFDKLELIEVIGGGGFGQVWKAKLRGTPVAVKVLTGSAQAKQVPRAVLEEFAAEINLLRGMQHPNICLYMGACVKPPNRAIVTELAANGSLWDALRLPLNPPYQPCDGVTCKGWPLSLYTPDARHGSPPTPESGRRLTPIPPKFTWPWKLVKKVALGMARGMAYLHSGVPPVLHRDLKSANILLDESYNPKVCDFGLSRLKAHERSMTGNCGTVQWMAPEVLASKPYNEKADVFSYGIICWELLSRQCPYDEMTAIQCALAVLNRNKRPEIPRWCPPALYAIIRSCVKKDPDERPSFEDIIKALDAMPDE